MLIKNKTNLIIPDINTLLKFVIYENSNIPNKYKNVFLKIFRFLMNQYQVLYYIQNRYLS